ncbi:SDR family oxidoreductase [Sphingomonas sp. NBWT7]|uniref:SDR family NAD(P)-dependent oxidoreductase n=1 Tax=Sphingomonas sp. NBWT7 TaxID=2596913 RepID=UPI001626B378|nr:SDR family NAD(P)-dependent oxidoreductase [Sphingomonas sp. NBWT7]QNE32127.1 SDR family oxidoreductase [Sphingomonas sp. NBWT7]
MEITNETAAIVTGGASGLGRATAEALAAAGVRVAIFDLNEEAGSEVAAAIGGLFCKVDITSEESVIAGLEQARAANGQERILVHCAMANRKGKTVGRNKQTGELTRFSTEDFEFATHGILIASYRLASLSALGMASLDPLEDGERGTIILTSSVAAQDAQIGQIAYGAGKAGINGMVLPMARDLMDLGIRVNAIMPGIFGTPLLGRLPQQVFDNLSASVPFPKRLGKPTEYASLALELIRNSYFNGQSIRLDGAIRMAPR